MYQITGACPKCGAPIYCEAPWFGTLPPPAVYSCACIRDQVQIETATHTETKEQP